jgi:plasmid stability protein
MAAITIRNLPAAVVQRIKRSAKRNGVSMEQELRTLLESRYGSREVLLETLRRRADTLPAVTAEEIEAWRHEDRR